MSHLLEIKKNGKVCMAWAGQKPWHNLGVEVSNDLTPNEMMKAAGLDWKVEKRTLFAEVGKKRVNVSKTTGKVGLVRVYPDGTEAPDVLDVVGKDWHEVQNQEAFEFFSEFVKNGHMKMETAGSIRGGKTVWALAATTDAFEAVRGDVTKGYMLFTNQLRYGAPTDVRLTNIRTVCNNTLSMALSQKLDAKDSVQVSHRMAFDPDKVKELMELAKHRFDEYAEQAKFLATKTYSEDDVIEFFDYVFPRTSDAKGKGEKSKQLARGMELLTTQPGHELAAGTWWQAFNAVTFITNHEWGKDDVRLENVWYGGTRKRNLDALTKALEFASK